MTGARGIAIDVAQRSTITLVIDSGKIQRIQVQGEDDDDVLELELLQPYGLTTVPPEGSEVVSVQPDGDPDQAVALAASHPDHRPTGLEPGDVALYRQGHGIRVFLGADGSVHLGTKDPGDYLALASKVDAEIDRIWNLLTTLWTPVAQDGGAALKAAATSEVGNVESVASSVVRAE